MRWNVVATHRDPALFAVVSSCAMVGGTGGRHPLGVRVEVLSSGAECLLLAHGARPPRTYGIATTIILGKRLFHECYSELARSISSGISCNILLRLSSRKRHHINQQRVDSLEMALHPRPSTARFSPDRADPFLIDPLFASGFGANLLIFGIPQARRDCKREGEQLRAEGILAQLEISPL